MSKSNNAGIKVIKIIGYCLLGIVLVFVGFSVQFNIRYEEFIVEGESMQPTFNALDGQRDEVFVNKYAKIKQGDLVVIEKQVGEVNLILKRCVATGGQTVNIIGNGEKEGTIENFKPSSTNNYATYDLDYYESYSVIVNGTALKEDYLLNEYATEEERNNTYLSFCYYLLEKYGSLDENPCTTDNVNDYYITLASDEIFALGDNRAVSLDSSFWGPFKLNFVVGRIDFVIKSGATTTQQFLLKIKFMFIIKP